MDWPRKVAHFRSSGRFRPALYVEGWLFVPEGLRGCRGWRQAILAGEDVKGAEIARAAGSCRTGGRGRRGWRQMFPNSNPQGRRFPFLELPRPMDATRGLVRPHIWL
jgi:hypothetical protein